MRFKAFSVIKRAISAYLFSMKEIVVIRGEGYESKNIIVKKGKRNGGAFLFFLMFFGAAVYLLSTVVFKSLFGDFLPISAFSFAF